ncbi:MAG TPA: hypothetical protein VGK73_20150 [Polyangiaceae bacterium]
MHRVRNITAAGLMALGGAVLAGGCVDNRSSLYIEGVFELTTTRCIAEPDSDAVMRASGVIDLAFANGYRAALLVGSQLFERGSREKLRTETSRLAIEGARITLYGTDGGETTYETTASGMVQPASGTDPGLAAVFAQLIRPDDLGNPLVEGDYGNLGPPGQAIVRMRVFGTTLGGQKIESGDFDYTVYVCEGCLITYPPEAADPDSDGYLCSFAADTATDDTDYCFLGQDQAIPCTRCVAFSDICRDPSQNPSYTPAQ